MKLIRANKSDIIDKIVAAFDEIAETYDEIVEAGLVPSLDWDDPKLLLTIGTYDDEEDEMFDFHETFMPLRPQWDGDDGVIIGGTVRRDIPNHRKALEHMLKPYFELFNCAKGNRLAFTIMLDAMPFLESPSEYELIGMPEEDDDECNAGTTNSVMSA